MAIRCVEWLTNKPRVFEELFNVISGTIFKWSVADLESKYSLKMKR
jgi:hypothetical protein